MVQHSKAVAAEIWAAKIIEAAADLAAVTWVEAALVKAVVGLAKAAVDSVAEIWAAADLVRVEAVSVVVSTMAVMACN